MEKEPYLRDLELKRHSATNRNIQIMRNSITNHWKIFLWGQLLEEITRDDVNIIFMTESMKILTHEQTKALFEAEWDNDRVKRTCLTACFTGMRESAILALQVRDISLICLFRFR